MGERLIGSKDEHQRRSSPKHPGWQAEEQHEVEEKWHSKFCCVGQEADTREGPRVVRGKPLQILWIIPNEWIISHPDARPGMGCNHAGNKNCTAEATAKASIGLLAQVTAEGGRPA